MANRPPDNALRDALRRLGANGDRAERFLDSAAEQLSSDRPLATHHAAYAIREALMSIVKLGARPRGLPEGAREVVHRSRGGASADRLAQSIRHLDDVLGGRAPNERQLEQAVARLARVPPTRATADLLEQFLTELKAANNGTHRDTPPDRTAVAAAYEATCVILRDLFGPISLRLTVRAYCSGEETSRRGTRRLFDRRSWVGCAATASIASARRLR